MAKPGRLFVSFVNIESLRQKCFFSGRTIALPAWGMKLILSFVIRKAPRRRRCREKKHVHRWKVLQTQPQPLQNPPQ